MKRLAENEKEVQSLESSMKEKKEAQAKAEAEANKLH